MSELTNSELDDCWNRNGTWGTETPKCSKLADVIHCRNCNFYRSAGHLMLDRKVPLDYVKQWTSEMAIPDGESSSPSESIITFRLNREWYSLSTQHFVEVSQIRNIHQIPHHTGNFILGVVNVSGVIRLCFSLSYLLGINPSSESDMKSNGIYKRYVVVAIKGRDFVFPVNEVGGILHYDAKDLQSAPSNIKNAKLVIGVLKFNSKQVACLDAEQLYLAAEAHFDE